jgi:hypothetical protein
MGGAVETHPLPSTKKGSNETSDVLKPFIFVSRHAAPLIAL